MSSSSSRQSQNQNFTDNRAVLGEGSNYANNGASVTTNTANYVLDNGAIRQAVDLAGDSLGLADSAMARNQQGLAQAFNFGSDAFGLADSAMTRSGQAVAQAFNFGSDAFGLADSAMTRSNQAAAQALDFATDSQAGAFAAVDKANSKAFGLGADALGLADSAMTRNNQALAQAFNFGADTIGEIGAANRGLQSTVRSALNSSLDFGADALTGALGQVDRTTAQAFNFGSDTIGEIGAANRGLQATVRSALNSSLDFGNDALAGAFGQVNKTAGQAFNFGADALGFADTALERALDHSTAATDNVLATMQATQRLTADAYNDAKGRGAMTDKLILGAIAAMAIVAFMAVRK